MSFDEKRARYWADMDTESGDYVVDGLRVARLACQDWRGHHLREALEEISRLRSLCLEAVEIGTRLGTVRTNEIGQHVDIEEAAGMLSVDPEAMQRVAWGVVVKLGAMLKNMEADRDSLRAQLAEACKARDEARASATEYMAQLAESRVEVHVLESRLAARDVALASALRERDETNAECERMREAIAAYVNAVEHKYEHNDGRGDVGPQYRALIQFAIAAALTPPKPQGEK